jgi:tRNA A-37 threonylcarbamoyl transferase component Bud32
MSSARGRLDPILGLPEPPPGQPPHQTMASAPEEPPEEPSAPAEERTVPDLPEEVPPPIEGYEILAPIGRGASGTVYRARSQAVDREVAIKVLHAHHRPDSRVVRRLQREARTTARLAHPHIVSAVDMGETAGRWWYAMEFVDGRSLAERLRAEGRIREREALRLFIPLCEALEHLAENGVVHRDIKPANILLDRRGARLADLGLAFAEDDPAITGAGGTLGTPHYISPEQAVDPRKADVRSDIWSFGATLYHAVCGRPPFAGESAAEVLAAVMHGRIPDPLELEPGLSRRLALVLRKCLTRAPERRYQDPRELLLDLERVRERRQPRVQRAQLDPVQRQPLPVQRMALVLGTVGALLLAAGAFMLPRLLRGEPQAADLAGAEVAAFEPLDELARRHAAGGRTPAELLGELVGLDPLVPQAHRRRYEELVRQVDADLRRAVRETQGDLEASIAAHVADGDLAGAWALYGDELEARLQKATGYGIAGLAQAGIDLVPWRDRLGLELESASETALSELEALLQDWRQRRLAQVEARLAEADWRAALATLTIPPEAELLAEAGFHVRLPSGSFDGLLDQLRFEFRLRGERIVDDWVGLDRELRNFVLTRRTTLEKRLRESRPRIPAADLLAADFERELFDRRLTREKMPAGVSQVALDELSDSMAALLAFEERLLEDDARADSEEVDELAADALRHRAYERGWQLWNELVGRIEAGARCEQSPARQELARRARSRREESRLLETFLGRVSERLWELDGQVIDLRWGAITYAGVRIQAGTDALSQGFKAEGIAGVLDVRRLPSVQIEAFAVGSPEADLDPVQRLALALFRFHEGRITDAQNALFSGPMPAEGSVADIGPDLADRISHALERAEERSAEREAEVRRLYESVIDPGFQGHSPRIALLRVARLLEEFADVPLVRQQRGELVRIRARLEEDERPSEQAELSRRFSPTTMELSSLGRVTLGYDFGEGLLGAWQRGDWAFDGLGLRLDPDIEVGGWDELAGQRALALALVEPFRPDHVEVVVRFETLGGARPGRLLWLSVAGFQVTLGSGDLPGASGPRHLMSSDDGDAFLQRLMAGEGRSSGALLVPGGPPRVLRFRAARRSGRCELYLDDVLLGQSSGLRAPAGDGRWLGLRSWGGVRVLSVILEGDR